MVQGSKIVRWGIPGWILMAWLLGVITITDPGTVTYIMEKDAFKSLSITAILASIGVPLGYLLHELYFAIFWTIRKIKIKEITGKVENFPYPLKWNEMNDKDKYFFIEYKWDNLINKQTESVRAEIKERYRDRLTLIHSLGTLLFSMFFTILLSSGWVVLYAEFTLFTTLIIILQIAVSLGIWKNYKYHSGNLMHYQGYYLDEMIKTS
ncbi:hypothetical protein [Alkalihalobacillus deserti]|uniref:hypothetical protein n=1 Tax=Alkalihalobacillus deserti TaxID=2879466 RepID=UPI001D158F5C|nr:hypothetical protein [Alkalihalobacillus deserti]